MYNSQVESFLWKLIVVFLVLLSNFIYLSVDPLKSCLFLISFLIFYLFFVSFNKNIWYSYFICLIFVSGVLAILVYFTSLSKMSLKNFNMNFIYFFFLILFVCLSTYFSLNFLNLSLIYLNFYFFFIIWMLSVLLGFFNFLSFMISFLKGLRKF